MKRELLLILSALMLVITGFSQQDLQFTHYFFNNQAFNPGAAGLDGKMSFGLTARNQWQGYLGHPNTGALNFATPFGINHGAGLTIIADQLGALSTFNIKGSYSYQLTLAEGKKLGLGIDAGLLSKSINYNAMIAEDIDIDPELNTTGSANATRPNIGLGVFYQSQTLFGGISAQNLVETTMKIGPSVSKVRRHFYLTAGYNYQLTESWMLKPSFLLKSDGTITQIDINALAEYDKKFWGGLTYRYQDAATAMIGMNIGALKIGYSYDFTTNVLREPTKAASHGSHEIFIGYTMRPLVPPSPPTYLDITWL